ncbi:MAG: hypothetical protein ACI4MJ_11295 [Aristaeellaceae bacterium]
MRDKTWRNVVHWLCNVSAAPNRFSWAWAAVREVLHMFTQAFKDAILAALLRISTIQAELAVSKLDTLSSICRLMAYNEAEDLPEKNDQERLIVFINAQPLPSHLEDVVQRGHAMMKNNTGLRTAFEAIQPSGSSVIRVGLGLRMTVDEMNGVLLSYHLQTVSWHRVEDMLLRYAVEQAWSYAAFQRAVAAYRVYRASAGISRGASSAAAKGLSDSDSAYLTRYNMSIFYREVASAKHQDDAVYKKLHELYAPIERSSSGAPRRTFLKMIRFLHSQFSGSIQDSCEEKDAVQEDAWAEQDTENMRGHEQSFGKCPHKRVQAAYCMLYEAAGLVPPEVSPEKAEMVVNQVIRAIQDIMAPRDPLHTLDIAEPKAWFDEQQKKDYARKREEALRRSTLQRSTYEDATSCDLILRAIERDFPQFLRRSYSQDATPEVMKRCITDVALSVQRVGLQRNAFDRSCRSSLFRLLLCCGCSSVRPLLFGSVAQVLRCFGFAVVPARPAGQPKEQIVELARQLRYTPRQLQRLELSLSRMTPSRISKVLHTMFVPQCITQRHLQDQLSAILNVFDPQRRNSEPSAGFLMMMAAYTFGYAVHNDRRAFHRERAARYVLNRLKEAWSGLNPDQLKQEPHYSTMLQLMDDAFAQLERQPLTDAPLSEQWLDALHGACARHSEQCREADLTMLQRYEQHQAMPTPVCADALMDIGIVSGGWEF